MQRPVLMVIWKFTWPYWRLHNMSYMGQVSGRAMQSAADIGTDAVITVKIAR